MSVRLTDPQTIIAKAYNVVERVFLSGRDSVTIILCDTGKAFVG
jgi:hypothetical protein